LLQSVARIRPSDNEILMNNQEINEAVAAKLGWKAVKIKQMLPEREETRWMDPSGVVQPWGKCHDYSTSIEAAWEIVNSLKDHGFTLRKADPLVRWYCSIFDWVTPGALNVEEEAETAPLAICMAFLKLP